MMKSAQVSALIAAAGVVLSSHALAQEQPPPPPPEGQPPPGQYQPPPGQYPQQPPAPGQPQQQPPPGQYPQQPPGQYPQQQPPPGQYPQQPPGQYPQQQPPPGQYPQQPPPGQYPQQPPGQYPPPPGQYQQPPQVYTEPPPPPEPVDKGIRKHDGFFFRIALGIGYLTDSVSTEGDQPLEFTASGFSIPTELAFGGTPAPGLVIGGAIYSHFLPSATADDVEVGFSTLDVEFEDSTVGLVAPFVDYYFDPEKGLHLQGAVGYAQLDAGEGFDDDGFLVTEAETFGGIGILVGFGWEAFVGDQWSVGVIGRLMYASISGESGHPTTGFVVDWTHSVLAPSVLFAVTYH